MNNNESHDFERELHEEEHKKRKISIRRNPEKKVRRKPLLPEIALATGIIGITCLIGYSNWKNSGAETLNSYLELEKTNITVKAGDTIDGISASLVDTEKYDSYPRREGFSIDNNFVIGNPKNKFEFGRTYIFRYDPAYLKRKNVRGK
jgi:hypothetical protein